jgi:hypothetical protein
LLPFRLKVWIQNLNEILRLELLSQTRTAPNLECRFGEMLRSIVIAQRW